MAFQLSRVYPRQTYMAARSACGVFRKPVTLQGAVFMPTENNTGYITAGSVRVSLDTFVRRSFPIHQQEA